MSEQERRVASTEESTPSSRAATIHGIARSVARVIESGSDRARELAATIAPKRNMPRRGERTGSRRRDSAKAAEDRHIGFRWLAREARLPGERDAEDVFRAVARGLGECVGGDQARHIASHLPLGLRLIWEDETSDAERPHSIEADEAIVRLQSRLGLAYKAEAEILLAIVCGWLKHLAPEERDDVAAVLSPGLRELWEKAQLPIVPPWRRLALHASPSP